MKLTPDEIRLVVFVLLALALGAAVKNYSQRRPIDLPPAARVTPSPPAPGDSE